MPISDVWPPEPALGWCSTIGVPDFGSRISLHTSPFGLS